MEIKNIQDIKYYVLDTSISLNFFNDDDDTDIYYLISAQDFNKFRYEYYHFVTSCLYSSSIEDKYKFSSIPVFECSNDIITKVGTIEYVYRPGKNGYTIAKDEKSMFFGLNFNVAHTYSTRKTLKNISRLFKQYFYEYRINK